MLNVHVHSQLQSQAISTTTAPTSNSSSTMSTAISSGSTAKNIRVVVRVRPPNTRELEQNQRTIIKCDTQHTLIFDPDEDEDEFFFHGAKQFHRDITRKQNKKLPMEFDEIFDDTAANVDVFEAAMKPLVQSVMAGFNCSAFVYGATGAGKTHTMLGNEAQPGITYLTMAYLFECMQELSAERKFDIGISYLEVYNEQVMNLLVKSEPLKLREDAGGVVVGGLRLKVIDSAEQLLQLLALGNQNRTQHPTDANAESSRSHAIFQVHIRMVNKTSGQKNTVKLSMIDLAGSERAASTKGIGVRFKEGASINKSLLALGNCINKLAAGAKHIPYRDSNLTRIIKDSLGGNCQTVMIANVSPSSLTYEDTYNTLKYASRAKKIRSSVRLNICKNNTPKDVLIKQLNDQNDEMLSLRERVKHLEARLAAAESSPKTAQIVAAAAHTKQSGRELSAELATWYERIDAIYRAMCDLMESSLRIDSNDKVCKFRTEIKQHADTAMQGLVLDGNSVKADIAWINASVDRFGKQAESSQEAVKQCRDRVTEKKLELKRLRRDVANSEYADILKRYLIGKEHEFDAVKKDFKNLHVLKINRIYNAEVQHLLNVQKLSNNIIQDDYYLLRANDMLDINMRENLEQLKRLMRGRRDVKFNGEGGAASGAVVASATANQASHMAMTASTTAALAGGASLTGVDSDVMDRFNITMADHGVEGTADDDDDDNYEDMPDAVELDATAVIVPAPKRRNRSMTAAGGASSLPSIADSSANKKPVKKLFKADSLSIRNAMLGKSSTTSTSTSTHKSTATTARVAPLPMARASAFAGSASQISSQFNATRTLSSSAAAANDQHQLPFDQLVAGSSSSDAMEVDGVSEPAVGTTQSILNAKSSQIKSKANLLRNILKENAAASTLYQKVAKINPKVGTTQATKIIATLNKENKRHSPVRVSPRPKTAPRQNNASRVRQRMLTAGTSSTESSTANLKSKFKVNPAK